MDGEAGRRLTERKGEHGKTAKELLEQQATAAPFTAILDTSKTSARKQFLHLHTPTFHAAVSMATPPMSSLPSPLSTEDEICETDLPTFVTALIECFEKGREGFFYFPYSYDY